MSEQMYIYDKDTLGIADVLEEFNSAEWSEKFWDDGPIKLVLPDYIQQLRNVKKGNLIVIEDLVYRVDQVQMESDSGAGTVSVNGLSFGLLKDRIIYPPAGQTHDQQNNVHGETAIKHYVDACLGPGAVNANRRLPSLTIPASAGRGSLITYQGRFQYLFDAIGEIGMASGVGWQLTFDPSAPGFVFDCLVGTDRSATVFFDVEFETALKTKLLSSDVGRKTFAYVAGQGTGVARTLVERFQGGVEPAGMERREMFVDARDLNDVAGALQLRGDAKLAETNVPDSFSLDVNPYGSFRYGEHFFLGDLVTVRNQTWDVSAVVRIVGVTKKASGGGTPDISVELGSPWPTIKSAVQGSIDGSHDGGAYV